MTKHTYRFSHLPGHTEQPASGQNNPNVTQEYDQLSGPYDTVDQWLAQEEELLDEPNLTSIQPHPLLYIQSQPKHHPSKASHFVQPVKFSSLPVWRSYAYHRDDNLVVSAPTGSGKTVIMELAMLRTILSSRTEVKIIYMAPTKSLCSERTKDWTNKFSQFGITCKEFTGDTETVSVEGIKNSTIMQIDEVHFLNEKRGAVLEACKISHSIRYIAVSATVPNLQDIADWLDARAMSFSEEFRPVRLERVVQSTSPKGNNMFLFEKNLDWKLLDLINKYSNNKPALIFCSTRKSTQSACETLLKMMEKRRIQTLGQNNPCLTDNLVQIKDKNLATFINKGIGFHHAGLDSSDRHNVEQLFMQKSIRVIATTSTLAVGVNLPAHLVIIKSTKGYQNGGWSEYPDLDILQMIGRAGRPGLDDSGIAVIMTTTEMESRYKSLVSGTNQIESSLHEELAEHLLSEICLNTITDDLSSIKWLQSTFLYVRVKKNPAYYRLKDIKLAKSPDALLQDICLKYLRILVDGGLVEEGGGGSGDCRHYSPTIYGKTMDQYFIKLQTMFNILKMEKCLSVRDVLWVVSSADEFKDMRFNAGDKPFLNDLQKDPNIQFHLKERVTTIQDRIFMIIQCVLSDVSLQGSSSGHKLVSDSYLAIQYASRITKAIIDCAVYQRDSAKLRHSLDLYKSLQAKIWYNSPFVLRQITGIGSQGVKTLAKNGISSLEHIRNAEAHRIEMVMHRRPPFGNEIKSVVNNIPRYSLEIKQSKGRNRNEQQIILNVTITLTSVNMKRQRYGKGFYTQFWAETNENELLDFRRIQVYKLQNGPQKFNIRVTIMSPSIRIICHVQSEDYIGVDIMETIKPNVDPTKFIAIAEPLFVSQPNLADTQSNDGLDDPGLDAAILEGLICETIAKDHVSRESEISTCAHPCCKVETNQNIPKKRKRTCLPDPKREKNLTSLQNSPKPIIVLDDHEDTRSSIAVVPHQSNISICESISENSFIENLPPKPKEIQPSDSNRDQQDIGLNEYDSDAFYDWDEKYADELCKMTEDPKQFQAIGTPKELSEPSSNPEKQFVEDPLDDVWDRTGDYAFHAFEDAFNKTHRVLQQDSVSVPENTKLIDTRAGDGCPRSNESDWGSFEEWLSNYVTIIDEH
ncbi:Sec63 Brl domain-containing protein [Phycomyces blakesleeanus]